MAVARQFDDVPMTVDEIAASVLIALPYVTGDWSLEAGRDCGFVVGHLRSPSGVLYFFSVDPVAMVVDELTRIDG